MNIASLGLIHLPSLRRQFAEGALHIAGGEAAFAANASPPGVSADRESSGGPCAPAPPDAPP